MKKTYYEDYKYSMQDVSRVYVGAKYTLGEILEEDEIPFKFRLVTERHILTESSLEDTLETHLYYLDPKCFLVQVYGQLKAKVKISILEEKKTLTGRKKVYVTRLIPVAELAAMPVAEKKLKGVVVQEIIMSKLALMSF